MPGENLVDLATAAVVAKARGEVDAQERFLRELARRVSGGPLSKDPEIRLYDFLRANRPSLQQIARTIAAYVDDSAEKAEAMQIICGNE